MNPKQPQPCLRLVANGTRGSGHRVPAPFRRPSAAHYVTDVLRDKARALLRSAAADPHGRPFYLQVRALPLLRAVGQRLLHASSLHPCRAAACPLCGTTSQPLRTALRCLPIRTALLRAALCAAFPSRRARRAAAAGAV